MNYDVVRYRPELRPGVIALYRHLISDDPVLNDCYFRWKHETNPYVDEPHVYVALCEGEVVGMRGFQGARWHLGNSGVRASWLLACDLAVDPAHRRKKLFYRIMQFALADLMKRGFESTLSWSANPITYSASLRSGWRLVGPYATWEIRTKRAARARKMGHHLSTWPIAWRLAGVPAALALHRGFGALDAAWSKAPASKCLSIARASEPEAMSELVARVGTRSIQHVRDAAYYEWRYRNPSCDYRFISWKEQRLEGFMVLQLARLGNAADIRIIDWQASEPEILEKMLSRVARTGGFDMLSIWTATLSEGFTKSLHSLGFRQKDESNGTPHYRPGLLAFGTAGADDLKPGADGADMFSSLGKWDLRMAYSDAF
ncbi:MAG: GNAT family N-acetyltransferase [Casimicrobiaceae bacterium]